MHANALFIQAGRLDTSRPAAALKLGDGVEAREGAVGCGPTGNPSSRFRFGWCGGACCGLSVPGLGGNEGCIAAGPCITGGPPLTPIKPGGPPIVGTVCTVGAGGRMGKLTPPILGTGENGIIGLGGNMTGRGGMPIPGNGLGGGGIGGGGPRHIILCLLLLKC